MEAVFVEQDRKAMSCVKENLKRTHLEARALTMTMDGTYQTTTQAPATEPPAGAPAADLMEMFTAQGTAESVPAAA